MNVHRHRGTRSPFRVGRVLVGGLAAAMAASIALVASPAQAAGNGVLNLVVTPTDTNGDPLTEISASGTPTTIVYKVQFSCTGDSCDGTKVTFNPTPYAEPNGLNPSGNNNMLRFASYVQPVGGAAMTGNDNVGRTINLGNLAAGTAGTFSMTYTASGTTGHEINAVQYLPEGASIPLSVVATADGSASKTANTSLTWRAGTLPPVGGPNGLGSTMLGNLVTKPGVSTYKNITMGTGSMTTAGGNAAYVATGAYEVVYHAPPEAVIGDVRIAGSNGALDTVAVVDNAAHTVTWKVGTKANPSFAARAGWGANTLTTANQGYYGAGTANQFVPEVDKAFFQYRSVQLTYPANNFPDRDANDCNFKTTVTSTMDVTATYLDADRTTRSATTTTSNDTVACASPFGGWNAPSKVVQTPGNQTANGDQDLGGGVSAVNVPAPGKSDIGTREWRINVANRGNTAATAVIDDDVSDDGPIKVNRITAYPGTGAEDADTWQTTVDWTDNTGATGTSQLTASGPSQYVDAAAGRWFTNVHAEMPIKAGAILRTDGTSVGVTLGLRFKVDDGSDPLIGQQYTNTADVKLVYPADADGDGNDDAYTDLNGNPFPSRQLSAQATRKVQLTKPVPVIVSTLTAPTILSSDPQVRPNTNVVLGTRGQTNQTWPNTTITPQSVFIAPVGWKILPGSAAMTSPGTGAFASIPSGVVISPVRQGVFGTETRDYVVATYPGPVTLGTSGAENWPALTATAYPTAAAVPGVSPVPTGWNGDDSGTWTSVVGGQSQTAPGQVRIISGTSNGAVTDTQDVDGDGNTTEQLAAVNIAQDGLRVGESDLLSVVKQLCVPLQGAPDGCSWVSSSAAARLPADATSVKYRLQVVNDGNTTLSNVVAYDVLPYAGDVSPLPAGGSRGSQFALPLASVDSVSPGVAVAGSGSTNPARPEVNSEAIGTVNDWGTPAAGNKALRLTVNGTLGAGESKEVVFTTTMPGNAQQGQQACNSVAMDSAATQETESPKVCVTLDAPLNVAPTATITSPADGAALDFGSSATYAFSCDDVDGNLASCVATDEDGDAVANGDTVDTTAVGSHSLTVVATDARGLTATKTVNFTVKAKPNTAPTASIASPANGADLEYGSSATYTFSCDDVDGNLVSCVGTDENGNVVANGSPVPTTATGAHSLTVKATDSEGLIGTKKVDFTVKRKPNVPPTVTIDKPIEGATYFEGQKVPAAYSCADSDGTVVTCQGPVANGSNIDTATAGTKTFTVNATDNEGAPGTKTVSYKVVAVAGICRGTGLSLLGLGLGDANPKTTPCANDTDRELNVNVVITNAIPLLGVPANTVSTGVITGATQKGAGSAAAQAGVDSLKINILGQTIEATALTSAASSALSSCGTPAATTATSSLASLKINGKSIANLTQPNLTVPLVVGYLGINERGVSGNTATATALRLNVLGVVDLSVGRSVAGATC